MAQARRIQAYATRWDELYPWYGNTVEHPVTLSVGSGTIQDVDPRPLDCKRKDVGSVSASVDFARELARKRESHDSSRRGLSAMPGTVGTHTSAAVCGSGASVARQEYAAGMVHGATVSCAAEGREGESQ